MIENSVIDKLIQLSKIFKEGYTVEVNNGKIQQYTRTNKPYVVSYKTILTIHNDTKTFNQVTLYDLNKCIIGAWLDTNTNIYYIELNKVYKNKSYALKIAKKYGQKAIYDNNKQKVIFIGGQNEKQNK